MVLKDKEQRMTKIELSKERQETDEVDEKREKTKEKKDERDKEERTQGKKDEEEELKEKKEKRKKDEEDDKKRILEKKLKSRSTSVLSGQASHIETPVKIGEQNKHMSNSLEKITSKESEKLKPKQNTVKEENKIIYVKSIKYNPIKYEKYEKPMMYKTEVGVSVNSIHKTKTSDGVEEHISKVGLEHFEEISKPLQRAEPKDIIKKFSSTTLYYEKLKGERDINGVKKYELRHYE